MLLNAHTATRSFRELQFDLKAFLEAFAEIMPMDELSDDGLVEIKWADGSVDMDCDIEGPEQTHFNSLTHAARTITGAKNISGRKFFGCAGKRLDAAAPVEAVAEAAGTGQLHTTYFLKGVEA